MIALNNQSNLEKQLTVIKIMSNIFINLRHHLHTFSAILFILCVLL